MDEDNAGEFRDIPEEAGGDAASDQIAEVPTRRVLPPGPAPQPQKFKPEATTVPEFDPQESHDEEEEEDYSEVLSDAQLRLEQGNLYQMIMNHNLFEGSDSDPKAIKNVQREIRNFAKERMEIMLGMRKETSVVERLEIDFPFNALEVDTLRALARTATKGASDNSDRYVPEVTRVTEELENIGPRRSLNPINTPRKSAPKPVQKQARQLPQKPTAPVKRPAVSESVQRILAEEGVTLEQLNEVYDPNREYLSAEQIANLTAEQIIERNNQISRRTKTVKSSGAVPMPSQESMEQHYSAIANTRHENANQHMQNVINNLLQQKK